MDKQKEFNIDLNSNRKKTKKEIKESIRNFYVEHPDELIPNYSNMKLCPVCNEPFQSIVEPEVDMRVDCKFIHNRRLNKSPCIVYFNGDMEEGKAYDSRFSRESEYKKAVECPVCGKAFQTTCLYGADENGKAIDCRFIHTEGICTVFKDGKTSIKMKEEKDKEKVFKKV